MKSRLRSALRCWMATSALTVAPCRSRLSTMCHSRHRFRGAYARGFRPPKRLRPGSSAGRSRSPSAPSPLPTEVGQRRMAGTTPGMEPRWGLHGVNKEPRAPYKCARHPVLPRQHRVLVVVGPDPGWRTGNAGVWRGVTGCVGHRSGCPRIIT